MNNIRKFSLVMAIFLLSATCPVFSGNLAKSENALPGDPWFAVGGSGERFGCPPMTFGPMGNPSISWNGTGEKGESVDSSPAVVGNRIYYSTYILKTTGKSTGAIVCRDTETGRLIWEFNAAKLEGGTFNPIFSSPVLAGEYSRTQDGKILPRYLIVGEGFHFDLGRITCLDLAPTYEKPGAKPEVHWIKQALCHVESSPCVLNGKVYIGAGDDGLWCIDLDSGDVRWHLEGFSCYYPLDGPLTGKLKSLKGQYVLVTGTTRVVGQSHESPGIVALDVKEVTQVSRAPASPLNKGNGFERSVWGKVMLETPSESEKRKLGDGVKTSGVRIEIQKIYLDVESSPIGTFLPNAPGSESKDMPPKTLASGRFGGKSPSLDDRPVIIFGCGVGGNKVCCVDANTGNFVWEYQAKFPAFGNPAIHDGKIYIGLGNGNMSESDSNPEGLVVCLSPSNGHEIWRFRPMDSIMGSVPARDGKVYAGSRDGNLYILNSANGTLLKKIPTGAAIVCSPTVTENAVYFTNQDGKVFCVDRSKSSLSWSFNLTPGQALYCSITAANGKLYSGSEKAGISCLVEKTSGMAPSHRQNLIARNDNLMYDLENSSPEICKNRNFFVRGTFRLGETRLAKIKAEAGSSFKAVPNGPLLGKIEKDETVRIIGTSGSWLLVRFRGREGYVLSQDVNFR